MNALPSGGMDRREHLRQYVLACLADNVLTPADLFAPLSIMEKLRTTLVGDLKQLGRDLAARATLGIAGTLWRNR